MILYHRLTNDTNVSQVSRHKLTAKAEKDILRALTLVVTKITKENDADTFLLAFLTSTERMMLAKRLAIILLLNEGFSDSEIANSLRVTRVTVSRLRYFYEARGAGFEIAFRILENDKYV